MVVLSTFDDMFLVVEYNHSNENVTFMTNSYMLINNIMINYKKFGLSPQILADRLIRN